MNTLRSDSQALARAGHESLRRGDARAARESFESLAASGAADASALVGLAHACRGLGDRDAAARALDQALRLDPRNLRGLVLRGDLLAEAGDPRAASAFYLAAVKVAPPENHLPAEARVELSRARQMCEQFAAQFEGHLRGRLASLGSTPRFAHSMELLFGRKQVYLQQPRYFYFPELPQIQFYDRALFPWLDRVEAATDEIRGELLEVMKDMSAFKPYVQGQPNRPTDGSKGGMLDNPAWSAFYLWKNGEPVAENAARCPRTLAALEAAPLSRIAGRSPSILFSLMRPGAHIPAHNGFVNTRLICHLPLIVPPGCHFRVGNEVRAWVEGKAWVFDDTVEHEAWNQSNETRVVLLFEIWRPELTEQERLLVASMFEAIDAYGAQKVAWEI